MDMKLHLQDSTLASSWQLSHRDGTDESANSKYLLSVRFTVGSTKCQYLGKVLSQNLWYDYAPWRFQTKFLMIAPYHRESTLSFGSLVFTYCICTWVVIIHPIMGLLLDWFLSPNTLGISDFLTMVAIENKTLVWPHFKLFYGLRSYLSEINEVLQMIQIVCGVHQTEKTTASRFIMTVSPQSPHG